MSLNFLHSFDVSFEGVTFCTEESKQPAVMAVCLHAAVLLLCPHFVWWSMDKTKAKCYVFLKFNMKLE